MVRFVDALQELGSPPYHIFFDKVFTSINPMPILRGKGVKAIGTVCEYRTKRCPLKDPKERGNKRKGSFDSKVDESEETIVCRWRISRVVAHQPRGEHLLQCGGHRASEADQPPPRSSQSWGTGPPAIPGEALSEGQRG